jgi:uncharacterized protein YbjQ (UPF0145 family)
MDCEERLIVEREEQKLRAIVLTTALDVPGKETERVISIVASEAAMGLNIFKDIANNWRDFFGGTSATSQKAIKQVREMCLNGLRQEAHKLRADAVIAVNFSYNQLDTGGMGGILLVAATGTAVSLQKDEA